MSEKNEPSNIKFQDGCKSTIIIIVLKYNESRPRRGTFGLFTLQQRFCLIDFKSVCSVIFKGKYFKKIISLNRLVKIKNLKFL